MDVYVTIRTIRTYLLLPTDDRVGNNKLLIYNDRIGHNENDIELSDSREE